MSEDSRRGLIISKLQDVLGRLFSREATEIDIYTPLVNLGADSLFLLQASQSIQKEFGVKVPFRLLLEDLSTVDALAAHLSQQLPAAVETPAQPLASDNQRETIPKVVVPQETPASSELIDVESDNMLQRIITQQLQINAGQLEIMTQQLELLRNWAGPDGYAAQVTENLTYAVPTQAQAPIEEEAAAAKSVSATAQSQAFEPDTFVPFHPFKKS